MAATKSIPLGYGAIRAATKHAGQQLATQRMMVFAADQKLSKKKGSGDKIQKLPDEKKKA